MVASQVGSSVRAVVVEMVVERSFAGEGMASVVAKSSRRRKLICGFSRWPPS